MSDAEQRHETELMKVKMDKVVVKIYKEEDRHSVLVYIRKYAHRVWGKTGRDANNE